MGKIKALAVAALAIASGAALAAGGGTLGGAEFGGVWTTLSDWVSGDVGGIVALLIFAVGLGTGILKQSLGAIVIGLGGALAVANGVTVISGIITAGLPVEHAAEVIKLGLPLI